MKNLMKFKKFSVKKEELKKIQGGHYMCWGVIDGDYSGGPTESTTDDTHYDSGLDMGVVCFAVATVKA